MASVDSLRVALAGRYRVDRELGQGGMATVYLAHDLKHDRDVALKVLRPELAAVLGRERFLTEIRLSAKLDHPHILTLIDSGESDGFLWYVLPYIRGESLRRTLERERQLSISEALTIARDIAGALDYAHRQGVIHRDVKPENVLVHEGEAMLTDFGIALAVREAGGERLTETGLSVGTPQDPSPEQATAERHLDARSDIYSLGAVLYEMLAGEPPFTGPTGQAVIAKMMTGRPTRLRTVRDTVPEGVDLAVARALAKVAADRFPSAEAFATALRETSPSGAPHPAGRRVWGWRTLLAAGLMGAAVLIWPLYRIAGRALWRSGSNPELASLYRRAQHSLDRRTTAGTIEAIKQYSALVRRDSTLGPAWTGLAKSYVRAYGRNFSLPGISHDSTLQLAVAAVERALAADSASADAWVAQAMVSRTVDPTDLGPEFHALRRAMAIDSLSGPAWHQLAVGLAETGDFAGAMKGWQRAVTVAPSYVEGVTFRGIGYYWRRQYDSAQIWVDSAVVLDANYLLARTVAGYVAIERGDFARGAAAFDAARRLGDDIEIANALAGSALAEARAGRRAEALALLRQADSLGGIHSPTSLHTAVYIAEAYAGLGETDRAVAWLARYQPQRDLHFQLHLRCDPPFAPIAGEPGFRDLLTPSTSRAERGC